MLSPAECDQVELKHGSTRGIILTRSIIKRRKPIKSDPGRHRGILIRECRTAPMDRRNGAFTPGQRRNEFHTADLTEN